MKKSLVAVMLGLMMTIAMTGCGGCGTEEVAIETEATEVVEETEEVVEETEVETEEVVEETEVETEVVEEVAEEPTEVETEVAEEPATEEVEETPVVSPYTYTELNQVMYAQSTVNVRDLPEQSGGKLGSLTTNQEVTVTGQCNETGWYRISYNGSEGFVSNSYLGTEKVAVKSSSGGSSGGSSGSSTPAASTDTSSVPEETVEESGGSAETPEEIMADVEAGWIMPDNWYCGLCGFETTSYDEYVAHMTGVHGMQ